MGNMQKVCELLLSGKTHKDLLAECYPRFIVYYVEKKLDKAQPHTLSNETIDDELLELKRKKERVKL